MILARRNAALAGAVALAGLALAGGAAEAQWWRQQKPSGGAATPCVLDRCLNGGTAAPTQPPQQTDTPDAAAEPPPPRRRYGGPNGYGGRTGGGSSGGASTGAPGDFDFYVLTLSWSSGYCATGGDDKGKSQCDLGAGLGFVVHGLWPQYQHGFPSNCSGGSPSSVALDEAKGLFPDAGLARYEWSKHGTCSGKNPQAYFADVRRAREAVTIPDDFQHPSSEQTAAPADIARAFIAANSGLRLSSMAVACKSQTLQEVRICFSKDLRGFQDCPEVARGGCRSRQISIPPVR